jgi:hypothetical protein
MPVKRSGGLKSNKLSKKTMSSAESLELVM